jgi:neutrophil factor 2
MSILPSDTYIHLIDQLRSKFPELHRHQERLSVNFKDEDGDMLSMQDEGDFEAAVDVARYVILLLRLFEGR